MAVRLTTATDYLSRTTGMPAFSSMTATWWMYQTADTPSFETMWYWAATSGFVDYVGCFVDDARILWIDSSLGSGSGFAGSATLALQTWHRIALVFDNTANTTTTYANGVQEAQVTSETETFTPGYEHFGRVDTLFFNGRVAALKTWTAALTLAEIELEWRQYLPERTANLHRVTPLLTHTDLVDYSGVTGVAWTGNGTLATEDGPPIPWRQGRRRRVPLVAGVAAGPTLSVSLQEPAILISTF